MIARLWHGVTPAEKSDAYLEFLRQRAIPDYRSTPGNRKVLILRRVEADRADFLLVTLWESLAAIARFAGRDVEKARYYPEDPQFLLEMEPKVTHYELAEEAGE
ncbi:MAG TPA: antibiotic biosynthesis monooxygenase [Candidatus Polarisedimenticolia bacterium]|nr:antibiotic biosynthesis monooxygenase [Candidatus Polarisedimenticolia bacterium]